MKNSIQIKLLYTTAIIFVATYPYLHLVKFPYNIPVLALLAALFTYWQKGSFRPIGFKKGKGLLKKVLLYFFVAELSFDLVIQPLVNVAFNEPADYSYYNKLQGNTRVYLRYLLYAWVSAAIAEEIVYRGFLLHAIEKLGVPKWAAVVLAAALFALVHLYQGWSGACITFLFGILFGIIYYRSGKNVWVNILVHGLIDSLFLTLAYFGALEYYESPFQFLSKLAGV